MKSDDTANAICPRSICPIFCYDWCQITWAFSVTYWNYFSQPDLAPLDLLSPAHFKSDCAKSIKRVINLQISPVSVTLLGNMVYIGIKPRRRDGHKRPFHRNIPISPPHLFQSSHFLQRDPLKHFRYLPF